MRKELAAALMAATNAPGTGLAAAALVIARIEYPHLDPEPYMARLDAMGAAAARLIERRTRESGDRSTIAAIQGLNDSLFQEQRFEGIDRDHYNDPRNSCLNEVLDRRTGIPITLAVVYMEVARRAGVQLDGVNFPGHFLVRSIAEDGSGLILDPFHGGALLSEHQCRIMLQKHVGSEVAFSPALLAPATRVQIVVRMLLNLKLLYVHMRSFPQARDVTELLLAMTPSALSELRDLQTYLKLSSLGEVDRDAREEHQQIWEHVKTLRRRVASLN